VETGMKKHSSVMNKSEICTKAHGDAEAGIERKSPTTFMNSSFLESRFAFPFCELEIAACGFALPSRDSTVTPKIETWNTPERPS
jgi:hypothetical protein